jgi:branched-chain amino acid transport system permease protein
LNLSHLPVPKGSRILSIEKRIGLLVGVLAAGLLAYLLVFHFRSLADWWQIRKVVVVQSMVSGVLIGGVYALIAIGLTMIFGVLNIINFAHGTLMTVGMYTTYCVYNAYGIDPYLSLFITIPLLFGLGMLIQRVIIRPVMGSPMHNQLLLTMGLSLLLMNLLLVIFKAEPMTLRTGYSGSRMFIGTVMISFPRLAAFGAALGIVVLLFFIMRHTDLGKAIRAAADDSDGAALSGINVRRMYLITFGFGAALVGAAGSMVMPFFTVTPHAGETFNILSYVIVVLGGMGSISGALIGGLIVGLTESLGAVFLPGSSKLVGVFLLFILILLFKPEGLMARRSRG